MTNEHGSTTDWIVHRRVPHAIYPEQGQHYYRLKDKVNRRLTKDWRTLGLTKTEAVVLEKMLCQSKAPWPWKYVLMGPSHFAADLFMVAGPSDLRRAVSSMRRKGFLNVGKVEMEGSGKWHGAPVRYPVLETSPDFVYFCLGMSDEFMVKDLPLTGNLKPSKVTGRPCPNVPSLGLEDYLYDGSVISSLAFKGADYEG